MPTRAAARRILSSLQARLLSAHVVAGDCSYSKSVNSEQRILYTIGISAECHDRLQVDFVDIVPVGTRVQGGIRPSAFAYVEGPAGRLQLFVPELIESGEIVDVNASIVDNPTSAVMPPGYLVVIDAGEEEDTMRS